MRSLLRSLLGYKTWTLAGLVLSEESRKALQAHLPLLKLPLLELLEVELRKGGDIVSVQRQIVLLAKGEEERLAKLHKNEQVTEKRQPFTVRSLNNAA